MTRPSRRAFNIPNRPLREASADDQSRRDFSNPQDVSVRASDVEKIKRDARTRRTTNGIEREGQRYERRKILWIVSHDIE